MLTRKFSEFASGGNIANNADTVGLFGGVNAQFNNPWTFLEPGTTGDRPAPDPSMYYRLRLNTTTQEYEYYNPISMMWLMVAINANNFTWQTVTSSPIQMMPNTGYFANSASLITFILPTASLVGEEVAIVGQGTGLWQIIQGNSQYINVSPITTTVGSSGSLSSTRQFDAIRLICDVANLGWTCESGPQGIITFI